MAHDLGIDLAGRLRALWVAVTALALHTAALPYPIDASIPPSTGAPSQCVPNHKDDSQVATDFRAQFGQRAHERMTELSAQRALAGQTQVAADSVALRTLLEPPAGSQRTILACCRYTKGSHYCRCLNDGVRTAKFSDPMPLVTGARWPDDPCHLLARGDTFFIPVHWFLGKSQWGNNLFYLSHFHDFAFLHSMASSGDKDERSVERTSVTRRRVLAWLEFAMGVASGHISSQASFAQAQAALSTDARPEFGRMFPGFIKQPKRWTVDFLFVGIQGADAMQVRQVALGAMLHTVQDAFSDAHVLRANRPRLGLPQPATNVGPIVQFLDYKQQNKLGKHAAGDEPPGDLFVASTDNTALHPIVVGSELIACAAGPTHSPAAANGGGESSAWSCARPFVLRVYEMAKDSRRAAGAGNYR